MMSNKLVVKCGNFAVLVDLHVLPQGTSKDTSWFSDHEKEEVCALLKDAIESRVKRHIESRRQQVQVKHKEYTQASPLFLKGSSIRIAAYFIKRWVNLRCVVKHQYRELYVFPDRFVVCASQLEPDSNMWVAGTGKPVSMKEASSGTSEYFAEHRESEINNLLSAAAGKQAVLKNIVKKVKPTKNDCSKFGRDCDARSRLRQADSEKGNKSNPQSESESRSAEQAEDCINTAQSSSGFPDTEVENDVNHSQPCTASSQQRLSPTERLQAQEPSKALSWICESALPKQKQTLRTSITQQKRRRHSSEGKTTLGCKKADLRDDTFLSTADKGAAEPVENIPLALRIRNIQKLSTVTVGAVVQAGKTAEVNKIEPITSENKLGLLSNSIPEERTREDARRPTDGQPKRLKLQRSKKLH
ncbi:protein SLX4IP isoform X2 [Pseudophryne corroboree]|uniref:protein SLX4IP isoform X2 n=1 Tax=Pseudophryne corroboree TaxID=495146 RepID=UPI0030816592